MGLADLRLINPQRFPDPQAHAMAAGASDILAAAQVSDTLEAALAGTVMAVGCTARRRDLSHRMLSAREAAPILMEQAAQTPVARRVRRLGRGVGQRLIRPFTSSVRLTSTIAIIASQRRERSGSNPSSTSRSSGSP